MAHKDDEEEDATISLVPAVTVVAVVGVTFLLFALEEGQDEDEEQATGTC